MKITAEAAHIMFCAVATAGFSADLNPLFQNNAVLQCDARVPAWGTGRDGWANVPEGNLFNRACLPASPFRTDAN